MPEQLAPMLTLLWRFVRGDMSETELESPFWWLVLYGCRSCGQGWLVAQEERHNDIFCMRRLDEAYPASSITTCGRTSLIDTNLSCASEKPSVAP